MSRVWVDSPSTLQLTNDTVPSRAVLAELVGRHFPGRTVRVEGPYIVGVGVETDELLEAIGTYLDAHRVSYRASQVHVPGWVA